jgi:hypothetical protein
LTASEGCQPDGANPVPNNIGFDTRGVGANHEVERTDGLEQQRGRFAGVLQQIRLPLA